MSDARSSWADLPREVLNLIRQRLLRKDYSNFRATCSSWNFKAAFDPLVYENVKYPFLLCFPNSGGDDDDSYAAYYKAYSAAYNKTYHIRTSSQLLVDAHVFCSADGWLLLGRGHQAFFYHPSTQDMIKLPVIRTDCKVPFGWMSFSARPTSSDCVVLGVTPSNSKEKTCFSFIRRGQRSWKHYQVSNRMMRVPHKLNSDDNNVARVSRVKRFRKIPCVGDFLWSDSTCSPVYYRGAFYCLARDGRLGVLKRENKKKKMWRIFDSTKKSDSFMDDPGNRAYLVECKGELISIVVAPMGEFVRIFKFHNRTKVWRVAYGLGDQTVLLSPVGCLSIPCGDDMQIQGFANTIHFPSFHENSHVFYEISTQQFHSFGGDYYVSEDDLYDTKLALSHAWVVPTFSVSYSPPRWSSKLPRREASEKDEQVENNARIRPYYAIRNLSFFQQSSTSSHTPLEDHVGSGMTMMMKMQEAHPCFVLTTEEGEELLVDLGKKSNHSRKNVELAGKIGSRLVINSSYGTLVLLSTSNGACSLLDPSSMIETPLPAWEATFRISDVVLIHSPPSDSRLHVIVFGCTKKDEELEMAEETEETEEDDAVVMVWRDGEETWTVHKMPSEQRIDSISGVVLYQGKIYGVCPTYNLVEMELLQSERLEIGVVPNVRFPESQNPKSMDLNSRLVESCGELLLLIGYYQDAFYLDSTDEADQGNIPAEMKVFKMDWSMMRWRMVKDLGDRAFFWCNTTCYSCCASECGFQRNSIYWIRPYDVKFHGFDYGDGTLTVFSPCPEIDAGLLPWFFMWYI